MHKKSEEVGVLDMNQRILDDLDGRVRNHTTAVENGGVEREYHTLRNTEKFCGSGWTGCIEIVLRN